jgi:hypothetical protein
MRPRVQTVYVSDAAFSIVLLRRWPPCGVGALGDLHAGPGAMSGREAGIRDWPLSAKEGIPGRRGAEPMSW